MMIYLLIYKTTIGGSNADLIYYLMLLPFLISYTLIPLFHGIWSGIYYGIFEAGSNPFHIPSLNEVSQVQENVDEINVEVK